MIHLSKRCMIRSTEQSLLSPIIYREHDISLAKHNSDKSKVNNSNSTYRGEYLFWDRCYPLDTPLTLLWMFVGGKMVEEEQTKMELEARLVESESMIRHYESVVRNRDQELNITKRVSKPPFLSLSGCRMRLRVFVILGSCSRSSDRVDTLLTLTHFAL